MFHWKHGPNLHLNPNSAHTWWMIIAKLLNILKVNFLICKIRLSCYLHMLLQGLKLYSVAKMPTGDPTVAINPSQNDQLQVIMLFVWDSERISLSCDVYVFEQTFPFIKILKTLEWKKCFFRPWNVPILSVFRTQHRDLHPLGPTQNSIQSWEQGERGDSLCQVGELGQKRSWALLPPATLCCSAAVVRTAPCKSLVSKSKDWWLPPGARVSLLRALEIGWPNLILNRWLWTH